MVNVLLSNKIITQDCLWAVLCLFSFGIIEAQENFNRSYNYEGAIQSNIGIVKEQDGFIYTFGWGIKNPETNNNFGLIFGKYNLNGRLLKYKYFNDPILGFVANLNDNFEIENDTLTTIIRGTDSEKHEILIIKHNFQNDSTYVTERYDKSFFGGEKFSVPGVYDFVKSGPDEYWFSGWNRIDGINKYYLFRYNNGDLIQKESRDTSFTKINFDGDFIYTIGTTSLCSEPNCGDLHLMKLNPEGEEILSKDLSNEIPVRSVNDIIIDGDGNIVLLGTWITERINDRGNPVYANIIAVFSNEFELLRSHQFTENASLIIRFEDLDESANREGYLLSGWKSSRDSSYYEPSGYVVKLDKQLNVEWDRSYSFFDPGFQEFFDVTKTIDGGYLLGGSSRPNPVIPEDSHLWSWLLKIDANGMLVTTSNENINKKYDKINIYPNPSHGSIILEEMDTPPLKYVITNSSGLEVYCLDSDGGNITHFVDLEVASGIYFVQIWSDGLLLDTRKIVVQN